MLPLTADRGKGERGQSGRQKGLSRRNQGKVEERRGEGDMTRRLTEGKKRRIMPNIKKDLEEG